MKDRIFRIVSWIAVGCLVIIPIIFAWSLFNKLVLLGIKLWLSVCIVAALVIIFFGSIIIHDWWDRNKWKTISHVPRWVRKQAKQLSMQFSNDNTSGEKRIIYLNGRWYKYRLYFSEFDGQLIKIQRKQNKFDDKGST